MKKVYGKEFHLTEVDWKTRQMTGHHARFLWNAIQKEDPELRTPYKAHFEEGAKYVLLIEEDEEGFFWIYAQRISKRKREANEEARLTKGQFLAMLKRSIEIGARPPRPPKSWGLDMRRF